MPPLGHAIIILFNGVGLLLAFLAFQHAQISEEQYSGQMSMMDQLLSAQRRLMEDATPGSMTWKMLWVSLILPIIFLIPSFINIYYARSWLSVLGNVLSLVGITVLSLGLIAITRWIVVHNRFPFRPMRMVLEGLDSDIAEVQKLHVLGQLDAAHEQIYRDVLIALQTRVEDYVAHGGKLSFAGLDIDSLADLTDPKDSFNEVRLDLELILMSVDLHEAMRFTTYDYRAKSVEDQHREFLRSIQIQRWITYLIFGFSAVQIISSL